jgi:hypothetical protein
MRLSPRHRLWIYWSAAAVFATGALWLLFHYFVQVEGEFGPAPHPLEHWWLRLHGFAAMLCLVLVGTLLPIHIRRGWHQRRNVTAGLLLVGIALLLALSGYALYYFGGEQTRPWISLFHWVLGLVAPAAMVGHLVTGRSTRSALRPRASEGAGVGRAAEPSRLGDEISGP